MWKLKKLLLLFIAVSLIVDCAQCKKRKTKRKKNQEEDSVVTYSPYFDNEEFKPSVIDGQGNFQGMGPETTTMGLYGPAFPTAEDTTPFSEFPGQVSGFSPFMSNIAPSDRDKVFQMFNDYHGKPAYDEIYGPSKDHSSQQDYDAYDYSSGDSTPIYGTKINVKDATKKPSLYGDTLNYQNIYSYASTWPTTNVDNLEDLKLSSSSYKNKFKMGPPLSDFSSFKGTFHTDFSENTYAYPTPEPVKDTYQSMKEQFSTNSKDTYQNAKDPFSTSSKDSYQTMKDSFSTNTKESYQTMKDSFSTNTKEPYHTVKDSFTPNFEETSYKTMKDPFSTKHSYLSLKDHYSPKDSYPTMSDEFSTSSKGLHKIKDPFSISSMNSYQNAKSPISNYNDYYKSKDSFPTSNQNVKNEFSSTSLTLEHGNSEDQKETFDFTDQDTYKPTVNILPNAYKKYKLNLNYSDPKYDFKNTNMYSSYKDQFKATPTEAYSTLNSIDLNDWKGAVKSHDTYANIKHSSKHTETDYSGMKNAFSLPEYVGSQSNIKNVIDFTGDNNPFKDSFYNSDFINMKDPSLRDAIDFSDIKNSYSNGDHTNSYNNIDNSVVHNWKQSKNKLPSDDSLTKHFALEFMNPTKSSLSDSSVPTMTSSHWGHLFKNYDPSSSLSNFHKSKKPQMDAEDDGPVLYIPNKKQTPTSFGKFGSGKTIEEWNKEVSERFKPEEELLGLRNHDTSHPSYLPTYKLKEELSDLKNYASNFDYGSVIEKWKHLNLQSKKPSAFETHTSEQQHGYNKVHVPYPKPYPVEIPHPVFVPVPQPYPVRVPVPKPVAVPVIREISVPVERPMPYPVIKKVPYPVDKLVPVPIEKPVPVPVMKPYPVPIPHVRPVFHHSHPRPYREDGNSLVDPDSEQYLQESRIRGHAERIHLRPVKSRRARIRPRQRRPSAQSRNQRGSRRRPPGRQHFQNFRRISTPRQTRGSPKQGHRVPKPGNRFPNPRERFHSLHNDKKQSSEEGDRYIDMGLSRYASQFKDLTMEEPSDGHDHSDYFKFCQNNPLCFVSSLKMPVLE